MQFGRRNVGGKSMKHCPVCGRGKLERRTRRQVFRYQGKRFRYEQPGMWCNTCSDGILENADMDATERQLYDFRAGVDGYLPTAEIRRIRKKLGLTQKRAGELFGRHWE